MIRRIIGEGTGYGPALQGARRVDDRKTISGIMHVIRSGCRWRALLKLALGAGGRPPEGLGAPSPLIYPGYRYIRNA